MVYAARVLQQKPAFSFPVATCGRWLGEIRLPDIGRRALAITPDPDHCSELPLVASR